MTTIDERPLTTAYLERLASEFNAVERRHKTGRQWVIENGHLRSTKTT